VWGSPQPTPQRCAGSGRCRRSVSTGSSSSTGRIPNRCSQSASGRTTNNDPAHGGPARGTGPAAAECLHSARRRVSARPPQRSATRVLPGRGVNRGLCTLHRSRSISWASILGCLVLTRLTCRIAAGGLPETVAQARDSQTKERTRSVSSTLRHRPERIYCRASSSNTAGPGALIHTAAGSAGGVGGWRTNRSGWAVYAAVRTDWRSASTTSASP